MGWVRMPGERGSQGHLGWRYLILAAAGPIWVAVTGPKCQTPVQSSFAVIGDLITTTCSGAPGRRTGGVVERLSGRG